MTIGSTLPTAPELRPQRPENDQVQQVEPPAQPNKEEDSLGLDKAEQQQVQELKQTDAEVRAHEQAHLAAASGLAGGVSFTFVTGPDGQRYAVSGEVSIDTSPVAGDPEATIRKAQQVQAAANAPAQPSGQDRAVAAQAAQLQAAARIELLQQQREQQTNAFDEPKATDSAEQILQAVA